MRLKPGLTSKQAYEIVSATAALTGRPEAAATLRCNLRPAATVPCGLSAAGNAIGLQIVGLSGAGGRAVAEFAALRLGCPTLLEI